MTKVLAIGRYDDNDLAALREMFGAACLDGLAGLYGFAGREGVEALAYKGAARLDAEAMALLPNLRLIANYGVGYDAIDVDAATARGISVTNTPEVLNDDVADLAVAIWLAQAREIEAGAAHVRSGAWTKGPLPLARKASGRRVGVLGLGRIGREIADRLAAFKCEIHYYARSPKDAPGWTFHADPVALAQAVDDLFIAVIGGPETKNLVDASVINALGPDGVVVNISRGSVVDEPALLDALEQTRIRGAALDVFRDEPSPNPRLTALPQVLPLPHIGSATTETRARMGELQRRNIAAHLAGEALLTPVN
ncbi:MAG: 2-hydroxyacid dehydrogenase [Paracoccus sp. (in: a-proteobacteria)]|nr:2-hydroxyacid dehydrogenase [Paracoccus sp. (in: a-proteobacteria)]